METQTNDCLKTGDEMTVLRSSALSGEAVPRRVLLAPWGHVDSTNGSFVVDEEGAALALRAFEEHGTDLPIDYEHQTLGGTYASPSGRAPAAGWIKQLVVEPGVGLLAQIEWTEEAEKMLVGREYRYLSPVAVVRKSDRKLVAIHSAALTNKPAIVGMQPIVNQDTNAPSEETGEPLAAMRTELELPVEAGAEEVLVAAGRRIAALQQQAVERHVSERVCEAIRAGKLVEAQRTWAEALVAREEALFDEWFRTAPVIVSAGQSAPPGRNGADHRRQTLAATARAEFRVHPMLSRLTTEEAFVSDALRAAAG